MNSSIKMEECAGMWLKSLKGCVKQSTYAKYCNIIKNHVSPYFGDYNVNQIDAKVVFEFIQNCRGEPYLLAEKSVRDIVTVLKAVLRYAVLNGYEYSCSPEAFMVRNRSKEIHVLTKEEQKRLECTLLGSNSLAARGIYLSLYTGIRLGELCALQWENLDLDNGVLHVKKTMQRVQLMDETAATKTKIIIESPKSMKSIRSIPLPWFLHEKLSGKKSGNSAAYFLTGQPDRYVEPRLCQQKFKKIIADCGIADTNFHVLRHTFATRCVEAGVEIKTLSEILGHTSVNITLNRYVHSSMEMKKANMEKLSPLSAVKSQS